MSAPIRFLGLAIVAYVGLRTASSALALDPAPADPSEGSATPVVAAEPTLPPGVPADMGPPPGPYAQAPAYAYGAPPGYPAAYPAAYGA